jgi:molybdopterin synthase sulfur carrier subunit
MQLELRFFANFREAVGSKTIEREYDEGTTIGEVLGSLQDEYDGLRGELLVDGNVPPQVNVLRNGRDVQYQAGIETVVEDGDRVSVFPPVAGG